MTRLSRLQPRHPAALMGVRTKRCLACRPDERRLHAWMGRSRWFFNRPPFHRPWDECATGRTGERELAGVPRCPHSTIAIATAACENPNGLAFSPMNARCMMPIRARAYSSTPSMSTLTASLTNHRSFASMSSPQESVPDGMKVDVQGACSARQLERRASHVYPAWAEPLIVLSHHSYGGNPAHARLTSLRASR